MLSSKFLIRLKRQICPQFWARVKRSNLEGGKFPHISPTRRGSMVGAEAVDWKRKKNVRFCYREPASPAII